MIIHVLYLWIPLTLQINAFKSQKCQKVDFCKTIIFSDFSCIFLNPNPNCSNILDMRNLSQEQVKKAFCYQKWFWLSLFESIDLVISNILQFLDFQP